MITKPVENLKYIPKYPNLEHQEEIFKLSKDLKYYGLLWEMGLGKTKELIDQACYLYLKGEIDGVLITAPKGVYLNWITEELPKHVPDNVNYRAASWNSDITKKEMQQTQKIMSAVDDRLDFLCINIEAFATKKGGMVAEAFLKSHYSMFIIDESTAIKNPAAVRTKTLLQLSRRADYRRIATGTPITQSPLDLFSQCEFLMPGCLGFHKFFQFKHYYAKIEIIAHGNRKYEKIKSYMNLEELTEKIKPFTSRLLKEDCLNLPEKIHVYRDVEQTKEQKQAYQNLKDMAMLMFEDESMLTVDSVLTVLIKLHQINCGHVIDDNGVTQRIKSNRALELINAIEETSGKSIIWCHFREDCNIVCEALEEQYGSGCCVRYTGAENDKERQVSLERFKGEARFFVATSAASKGLTLIQAKYAIYYSYGYNLETYLQSLDRIHRIGQNKNVTYIYLRVRGSVDDKVIRALSEKKNIADQVLDFKSIF